MERHPEVQFHAISDVGPELPSLPADRVTFIPWSRAVEVRGLQEADVGIMPLVDDENGRCKCGFKMLQYMGCALPSIVTPIGLNADILANPGCGLGASTTDEWVDALEYLYQNRDEAVRMGAEGRRVAVEHYNRPVIAKQIADLFYEVVGSK